MKFHILYNNETIIPNISQNIRKWPVSYDIDNAEVIYIPDESINEVCNESCFSEMK